MTNPANPGTGYKMHITESMKSAARNAMTLAKSHGIAWSRAAMLNEDFMLAAMAPAFAEHIELVLDAEPASAQEEWIDAAMAQLRKVVAEDRKTMSAEELIAEGLIPRIAYEHVARRDAGLLN